MRCKNAVLFNKIGVPKLEEHTEVTFSLMRDLSDCNTINTRDYIDSDYDVFYNVFDRPYNAFDCDGGFCTNTGTLNVSAQDTQGKVKYAIALKAEEFINGVITFYRKGEVDVLISDSATFTNANSYAFTGTTAEDEEFKPELIDLMSGSFTKVGSGWGGTGDVIFIAFAGHGTTASDIENFAISSINFYKTLYDLTVGDVVKIACLSEVGGSFDISALEKTCLSSGYDHTSLNGGIDWTVTGSLITGNYWKLNPLAGDRSDHGSAIGYRIHTAKAVVGSDGTVTIADFNFDKCDFVGAQIADKCVNKSVDTLKRVMIPIDSTIELDLGYDQFTVVKTTGGAKFSFSTYTAGKEVLITYPQEVNVDERIVGNSDNIGEVRVKMSYPVKLSDGTEEIHTFNNVLITSFPASLSNEDSEFTFTINIQQDANGDWFDIQRVSGEVGVKVN